MKLFYTFFQYIKFVFSARNTRGNGVHSPFVYDFFEKVIYEKNPYYCFHEIEKLRNMLKNNNKMLSINDFGTGEQRAAKISKIARRSLKSPRYAQMLFRAALFCKSENLWELGTSLGITTAYLAKTDSKNRVTSMEGSAEIAKIAANIFKSLNINNINIIVGNIDQTIDAALYATDKIDFAFIDANHRYSAVIQYFNKIIPKLHENSVVVIDDLYWSKPMTKAWNEIKNHSTVVSTIDLFQTGFVFFNKKLPKKHYKAVK
ncbi:MAG: class I SAM-dependent methyltransferase [Prevotellaceae bacterium]|jgi:predicted O-methyltransferase YrrM|nr:class I SAM-dependent methyltransferase [Prevotellaceae bacterium]